MHIKNTLQQIKYKLNHAQHIIDRIEKSEIVEPIDVDSLLQELRSAYNKTYQLGWDDINTTEHEQPRLAVVHDNQENEQKFPVLKIDSESNKTSKTEATVLEQQDRAVEPNSIETPAEDIEEITKDEIDLNTEVKQNEQETEDIAVNVCNFDINNEENFGDEPIKSIKSQEKNFTKFDENSHNPELETANGNVEETTAAFKEYITASEATNPEFPINKSSDIKPAAELPTIKIDANHPPISDIRTALSINDKFSLSNKLFNGNGTAFNLSLNVLNGFDNITEAKQYLHTMLEQNNWVVDSAEFLLLCELVERRYYR